ncbi:MAG: efflux RND transporter periplasmic adaptor subunit [Mucilaginibacter sp.]
MNRIIHNYLKPFAALVLFGLLFPACQNHQTTGQKAATIKSEAYYTCSMHPHVHESHPGNCPICGMKLIRVEMTKTNDQQAGRIVLTAAQMQLAEIQTYTVRPAYTGAQKTVTGTVAINENGTNELTARLTGRIQQLFIRSVGEQISKGQPVYTIYSEDLQEAEKEYLLAREQQQKLHNPDVDYKMLISAAENKLKLWGLTTAQIAKLAKSGQTQPTTTMLSTISGTVSDIGVHEGDYVTEGTTILKATQLNTVWVEAQLYPNEAGDYKIKDAVNVTFPDLGNNIIKGQVDFINPELSENSKVVLVRITVPNTGGLIKPGMQAYVSIGTGERPLAIPNTAVIAGGKGNVVWVRNNDGSFSPKMVELGDGNNNYVEITSGLTNGEIVVTGGAYLLNSEAIFRNGSDQGNMAGMKM